MPIIPKQQPPYYTPGTTNPEPPIQTLFTQTTIQEATTTPIDTANYNIPANTLTENGQIIEASYWGNAYNNATGVEKTINIDGNAEPLTNIDGNKAYNVKVQLIRSTSTILYYTITSNIDNEQPNILSGGYTVDYTLPINLNLQIAATTGGNIRLTSAYVIKIS